MHDDPTGELTLNELSIYVYSGVLWMDSAEFCGKGQNSANRIRRKYPHKRRLRSIPPNFHPQNN